MNHRTPCLANASADTAFSDAGAVVTSLRQAWPQALAIYAFGSRVNHVAGRDSDLDLAILMPGYSDAIQRWEIANQLASSVGYDVDLLDLRAASTVMQYQVITTGCCLWARQPDADLFECFVLNEKLALDEARAGLLADITREGTVYGR